MILPHEINEQSFNEHTIKVVVSNVGTDIESDDNLIELMEILEGIDENKAAAKLNEISYISNDGGRVYY